MPITQKRKQPPQKKRRKQVRRRAPRRFSLARASLAVLFLILAFALGSQFGSSGDRTDYTVASRGAVPTAEPAALTLESAEESQSPYSLELPTDTPVITASPTPDNSPVLTQEPTSAPTSEPAATDVSEWRIQLDDKGDTVKALQRRLAALGYLSSGEVDGVYGNKTKNALIEYQKAAGLSGNGVCDYDTYLSISSDSAPAKQKQSGGGGGATVYVTRTGEKYHYSGCQYIKGKTDLTKMTKDEARKRGYTACKKCGR